MVRVRTQYRQRPASVTFDSATQLRFRAFMIVSVRKAVPYGPTRRSVEHTLSADVIRTVTPKLGNTATERNSDTRNNASGSSAPSPLTGGDARTAAQ
jgi:hypothetical protein